MKRLTALATPFVMAFGIAAGLTFLMAEDASAIWQCSWECTTRIDRTSTMGDPCHPWECQVRLRSTCTGGPLDCEYVNYVFGCDDCNGGLIRIIGGHF